MERLQNLDHILVLRLSSCIQNVTCRLQNISIVEGVCVCPQLQPTCFRHYRYREKKHSDKSVLSQVCHSGTQHTFHTYQVSCHTAATCNEDISVFKKCVVQVAYECGLLALRRCISLSRPERSIFVTRFSVLSESLSVI